MDRVIAAFGPRAEVTESVWTQEYAGVYIGALRWNTHRLVREVVRANGWLDASVMRGADGQGTLRGVTGPLRKVKNRLVAEGKLPPGLPIAVEPDYVSASASWHRAPGFKMAPELVPLFAAAFAARSAELRSNPNSGSA
jgi:hypothetical protein